MYCIDEVNLNKEKEILFEIKADTIKKNFEKRRINVHTFLQKDDLLGYIKDFINERSHIKPG